jgi:hypothetical protein
MSTISRFLAAKQPLFDHSLHQLELLSGKKGLDVKLAAELAEKAADRIKRLGLPADADGPTIYAGLIERVKADDEATAKLIGGKHSTNLSEMIPLIVKAGEAAPLPKDGWFLKEAKARDMLRGNPPEAVMEVLGYHLVSQLLEHEDIYELFLALRFVQPPEWLNQFDATYTKLVATDFEHRTIKIVPFAASKWGNIAEHFIAKKRHNITHSKEMGAIAVMPMTETHMTGVTLKALPLLIHYYNEIRLYSSFFRLVKAKPNFGEIVANTLIADPSHVKITDNDHIHWRVIQRYFGKLTNEHHPEIFEPHLQPEDLHWRRAEDVLFEINPKLEFWQDMDYVAVLRDNQPVTFNLFDLSFGYSNGIGYEDRYLYHFREALWNETFARYMGEKALEEQLLIKLNNAVVAPETLVRHGA